MNKTRTDNDCESTIVRDLLGLVMEIPPALQTIESWTPAQRLQAEEWAAREHLAASDNPIRRRPRPDFIDSDFID